MPTCPICQTQLANSKVGYSAHLKKCSPRSKAKVIVPENKTGRTKEQIVADYEARNYRFIIDPKVCAEDCSCNACFNRALDRLVASTEEAANACQRNLAGRLDSNELPADPGADQA